MKNNNGFTLLELLIAVFIFSVISSIALPSYQNYAKRAKRAEAIDMAFEVIARQKRFLIQNFYTANEFKHLKLEDKIKGMKYYEYELSWPKNKILYDEDGHEITIPYDKEDEFIITAYPKFDDAECGNLIYNSYTGEFTASTGNKNCWRN